MELRPVEIRVLGCLLEKQHTTPDAYPLTLNSLRLACNQSTNRNPIVAYDEDVIREAVDRMGRRGFVRLASGAGSRASKYRHLLAERLPMDEAEQAVMCVLMLRGPQTPGELKQRGERMHPFAGLDEVDATLERLIARSLARRLPRRPGQKEERYAHLLEGEPDDAVDGADQDAEVAGESQHGTAWPATQPVPAARSDAPRPAAGGLSEQGAQPWLAALARLEERVARLERELVDLRAELGD